jgi:hypothetical protein
MSGPAELAPELRSASHDATRSDIARAVQTATSSTGTPFNTLVAIAGAESGFRPEARNKHSSAAGPYQITETTWLHLVKTYGAQAGRADLASLVHKDGDGRLSVNPADRAVVLGARHDVDLSSRLAAKYCDECRAGLARKLGRTPSEEEVRVAYFLGVGGAVRLMTAATERPGTSINALLPRAFANHRSMFTALGRPLNAQQALTLLESRYARQIAQGEALKSYADAGNLAPGDITDAPPAAAPPPAPVATAAASVAPDAAAAAKAAPQLAAAEQPKELACKTTPQGGVTCAL